MNLKEKQEYAKKWLVKNLEQFEPKSYTINEVEKSVNDLLSDIEKEEEGKLNHAINWIEGQGNSVGFRQPISNLTRTGILEFLRDN